MAKPYRQIDQEDEADIIVTCVFSYDNTFAEDSDPLYRLYNPNDGLHHWTMDSNERDVLIGFGWIDEGIACYVFP